VVIGKGFKLKVFYDNNELPLDNNLYASFKLYEILHYGIYYGELKILNITSVWKEFPMLSGAKIKIKIEQEENVEKTYKFILYEPVIDDRYLTLVLLPEVFEKIGKDKKTKSFNNQIQNIIKQIATSAGITQFDIDTTRIPSGKFLQLNKPDLYFMLDLVSKASGNNSNFIFFIDKENKLKFYSIGYLKNKQPVLVISDELIKDLKIDDKSLSYQINSGFGATGFYFDWDSGDMKKYEFDQSKFNQVNKSNTISDKLGVMKEYINVNNSILMLDPIGKNVYRDELYNKASIENVVLRKNYFNIFLSFKTYGSLKCTPAEIVQFYLRSLTKDSFNKLYSGKWLVYSVKHVFQIEGYNMNVVLTNSSFYNVNNKNII
jgi:hypothetical protein